MKAPGSLHNLSSWFDRIWSNLTKKVSDEVPISLDGSFQNHQVPPPSSSSRGQERATAAVTKERQSTYWTHPSTGHQVPVAVMLEARTEGPAAVAKILKKLKCASKS